MEYSHAERVILPVNDVAQLAYPIEVPSHKWYPNLLRPQDQMRSGFNLVVDRSQIIMDLTGIPVDDQEVYHDFVCTSIVKAVCRVKDESNLLYTVAICSGEDI